MTKMTISVLTRVLSGAAAKNGFWSVMKFQDVVEFGNVSANILNRGERQGRQVAQEDII
jgi:hypothetical protein